MTPVSYYSWQLVLLALLGGALVARLAPPDVPSMVRRSLDGRGLPFVAGVVGAGAVWYMWGSLHPVPYIHDEAAYLLQAEMLARGAFAGPARPLPEFFEQFHVFVTPVLAVRYPPGWALALVPGIWLGAPALVPIVLSGLSASLVVILARRIAGPAAAILALGLWLGAPIETRFRPTFLSEHLSVLLWLLGWWALWNWREDRRTRWLVVVSIATAWMGITRPLTGVAYALPVGIVVLTDVVRLRLWRQLAVAFAAGLPLCTLVPLQNKLVMGTWVQTPTRAYSETYTPYDLPGLGLDLRKPLIAPTPDRRAFGRSFRAEHADHVAERLPEILGERWEAVVHDAAWRWGVAGFTALLLLGVVGGGSVIAFGGLSAITLMVAYLWFAHPAEWTVYYMELHVVLVVAVAMGAGRLAEIVGRWRIFAPRADDPALAARRRALILVALALYATPDTVRALEWGRARRAETAAPHAALAAVEGALSTPAIIFIRNAPDHDVHRGLIENRFDLATASVWRVRDLGTHNADLIRLAPDRVPLLFDEATATLRVLGADGATLLPAATSAR